MTGYESSPFADRHPPVSILAGMHGQLRAKPVADVCRELAETRATGVLHIAGLESAGLLVFDQGRLVAASSPTPGSRLGDRLVNGGLLAEAALERVLEEQTDASPGERPRLGQLLVDRGLVPLDAVRLVVQEQLLDAVFDLVDWRDGTYRFEADAQPDAPEVPLAVPVDQALMEVSRRREEWESVSEAIPTLDAVPRFREGASTSTADLEPDEFAVMASVDGARSVRDLAYDLGYGEFEAARVVYALSLLGLVEVVPPVDEIGAALDDALAYVGGQAAEEPAWEHAPASGHRVDTPETAHGADAPSPAPPAADEPDGAEEPHGLEVGDLAEEADGLDELTATVNDFDEPSDDAEAPDEPAAREPDWSASADDDPDVWSSLDELGGLGEPDGREDSPPPAPSPTAHGDAPEPTAHGDAPGPTAHSDAPEATTQGEALEPPPEERTLEADLPDMSGFEELRLADRNEKPTAAPTPPEPEPTPEDASPTSPPPRRWSPAAADGDVSEFLRELSRLALDDDEEADDAQTPSTPPPADTRPPAPQPPRRPTPPPREEPKKKKRGLFGFGS